MIGKTYLLRGEPVVVLVRADWKAGGPRNVLVQRGDGSRLVRPFRGLRRAVAGPGHVGDLMAMTERAMIHHVSCTLHSADPDTEDFKKTQALAQRLERYARKLGFETMYENVDRDDG